MDYKIVAKALTIRLQQCLPFIINEDQTGHAKHIYRSTHQILIYNSVLYYVDMVVKGL